MKFTERGLITVEARLFNEPRGLREANQNVIEIIVGDTGCGIESGKLESIFREFEQVESTDLEHGHNSPGLGKYQINVSLPSILFNHICRPGSRCRCTNSGAIGRTTSGEFEARRRLAFLVLDTLYDSQNLVTDPIFLVW